MYYMAWYGTVTTKLIPRDSVSIIHDHDQEPNVTKNVISRVIMMGNNGYANCVLSVVQTVSAMAIMSCICNGIMPCTR